MSNFRPLPPAEAEALGHLMYAAFWGSPDVRLSEGDPSSAVRVRRGDLQWHLDMARRMAAAAERTDVDTYFDKIGL